MMNREGESSSMMINESVVGQSELNIGSGMAASGEMGSTSGLASGGGSSGSGLSRYESQKRRDWNTFGQYLRNHRPPLSLGRCGSDHVLEFLGYLDQFGKTKIHVPTCPFFGQPNPPAPCACPLRQAWGSLDALIGRLRAAFEEHGGKPESNPFGARQVRLYLRQVRDVQAKARGISYEKKKRKRPPQLPPQPQQQQQQQPQQLHLQQPLVVPPSPSPSPPQYPPSMGGYAQAPLQHPFSYHAHMKLPDHDPDHHDHDQLLPFHGNLSAHH